MSNLSDFLKSSLGSDDFSVYPLAGDASNRRYHRVVHNEQSWVLMEWDPFTDDADYPFLSVLRHFKKHDVHVPEVKGLSPDEGLVLLEDLGDLTLERKFWEGRDQSRLVPFYKQAIDELIKIHFDSTEDKSPCTAFQIEFDTEKLLWEMNYCRKHLMEDVCQLQLSANESASLDRCFNNICERLHEQPKRIVHRDYHSRNLMIKFDKMRVIDFQDARLGPVQYDLVSLLRDSYVDLDHELTDTVIDYYLERAWDKSNDMGSKDQFLEIYELQSIQRCFKACGSFASFLNARGDKRYLKYITPTLHRVLNSLAGFSEYREMADIILNHQLAERDYLSL